MNERRNCFGYPLAEHPWESNAIRDEIEMLDQEPLLPAWVLWAGVVILVALAAYAWVWP